MTPLFGLRRAKGANLDTLVKLRRTIIFHKRVQSLSEIVPYENPDSCTGKGYRKAAGCY